eukprot:2770295-Rhodomonas_salina.1
MERVPCALEFYQVLSPCAREPCSLLAPDTVFQDAYGVVRGCTPGEGVGGKEARGSEARGAGAAVTRESP